uniref:AMP-binding domain-containing protein n=1 Tax=Macrostomum lignano TaxID=282301 RepID=A0A1I8F322_9PLAT
RIVIDEDLLSFFVRYGVDAGACLRPALSACFGEMVWLAACQAAGWAAVCLAARDPLTVRARSAVSELLRCRSVLLHCCDATGVLNGRGLLFCCFKRARLSQRIAERDVGLLQQIFAEVYRSSICTIHCFQAIGVDKFARTSSSSSPLLRLGRQSVDSGLQKQQFGQPGSFELVCVSELIDWQRERRQSGRALPVWLKAIGLLPLATEAATALYIQELLSPDELVLPLIGQDKVGVAEEFLDSNPDAQLATLRYLDDALENGKSALINRCLSRAALSDQLDQLIRSILRRPELQREIGDQALMAARRKLDEAFELTPCPRVCWTMEGPASPAARIATQPGGSCRQLGGSRSAKMDQSDGLSGGFASASASQPELANHWTLIAASRLGIDAEWSSNSNSCPASSSALIQLLQIAIEEPNCRVYLFDLPRPVAGEATGLAQSDWRPGRSRRCPSCGIGIGEDLRRLIQGLVDLDGLAKRLVAEASGAAAHRLKPVRLDENECGGERGLSELCRPASARQAFGQI